MKLRKTAGQKSDKTGDPVVPGPVPTTVNGRDPAAVPAGVLQIPHFQDLQTTLRSALGVDITSGILTFRPGHDKRVIDGSGYSLGVPGTVVRRTQLLWDNLPADGNPASLNSDQLFAYLQVTEAACTDFVSMKTSDAAYKSILDLSKASNAIGESMWKTYIKDLSQRLWSREDVTADESKLILAMRTNIESNVGNRSADVAKYICVVMAMSPHAIVR